MSENEPAGTRIQIGPRKEPTTAPPSSFGDKRRALWFQDRCIPDADVHKLIDERTAAPRLASLDWDFVGPSNIGGRCTAIAVHPEDIETVYLGAANGGVWVSHNGGLLWRPLWDRQEVMSIGALTLDPANPDIIYAGSGEANLTGDNYPGVGLYRSKDKGITWELLAPSKTSGIPQRIGTIAINPTDSNHILLGGVAFGAEKPAGLFVSRDGGATWTRETTFATHNYRCHSIVFHPDGKTVYAAVDVQGFNSGVWRSEDSGATWRRLEEGLPRGSAFGRTSLALCQGKPEVLYAIAADRASRVLGVFRTVNGGEIWSSASWDHFVRESQMSYNNCIAVHPDFHDFVICGGVDLHLTIDGGKTWTQATDWTAERDNNGYAHADHHALAIVSRLPGLLRIYSANDGGVDYSQDGGIAWSNRSNTLGATMFYTVDVAQSDGNTFGGGSQDNGSLATTTGRADRFQQVLGGDGGWMVFDPNDATHLYASYDRMHIYRHRANDGWVNVTPNADSNERAAVWMAKIVMDHSCPSTVFTASKRVWRTRNDGDSWIPVSPILDNSVVTALVVSPFDPRVIFAATQKGGIFRSVDGGNSWSEDLGGPLLTGKPITDLAPSPEGSNILFAALGSAGHPHVFHAMNATDPRGDVVWTPAAGMLPDVTIHALEFATNDGIALFAGGDAGVFRTADRGESWTNVSGNLPHVSVHALAYHNGDRTMTAATYGRGLWRLQLV